jgi:hypothetical protein
MDKHAAVRGMHLLSVLEALAFTSTLFQCFSCEAKGSGAKILILAGTVALAPAPIPHGVRLSPDEKVLYVSTNSDVTTLSFNESAPSVALAYSIPMSTEVSGITTVMPSGTRGYLTVTGSLPSVGGSLGLHKINPANGCLMQTPNSPVNPGPHSIAAS